MMAGQKKKDVIGTLTDTVDYEGALQRIAVAARERLPFAVPALAVLGVMTDYIDHEHRARLNHLDLVLPNGQPVRWASNLLHETNPSDRVYGRRRRSRFVSWSSVRNLEYISIRSGQFPRLRHARKPIDESRFS